MTKELNDLRSNRRGCACLRRLLKGIKCRRGDKPASSPGGRKGFQLTGLLIFTAASILLVPAQAWTQTVVGTINAPPETYWNDMVLYQTGGKLFVSDNTNAQILIYDANSLDYVDVISLSSFLPDRPQCMALHEGTGTLYVNVSTGYATSDTTTVIIDADTYAIMDTLTDIGWDLTLRIDESRSRLYTRGNTLEFGMDETLTAIDINTNSVVGSLNIDDLMGGGIIVSSRRNLNPLTGELFFSNIHYDKFVVVDGPSLTGELISVQGSRGSGGGTWNPQENKLYITRAAWNGYFIYDRDTATSNIANSHNDGTSLFYSQATNRVYSGAEVNGDTTVIEGDTDAWQDVEVGSGLSQVGLVNLMRHAYFASSRLVCILDEDSLTVVDSIDSCRPDSYGAVSTRIIVNQNKRRVFILSHWSDPEEGSCVLVIEELEQYTLTIAAGTGGTTDPSPGTHSYDAETEATITATPDTNYDFSHWSGDVPQGYENDNPLTITMDSDKSITANFVRKQYTLTLGAGNNGTTDPAPGTYTYDSETEVTIKATPDIGYRFSGWTGDVPSGHENDNPITITMDSDKAITANFIQQYTLTIAAGTGGTTNPSPGSYVHDYGTQVSITAVPGSGYQFSGWTGDASGTTNPITIAMDSDKSITANFSPIQCTLTITAGTGGTTNPAPGSHPYDYGTQVSVTATASSGYQFSGWSGDASGTTNPITITMNSDKSITASFSVITTDGGDGETGKKGGCFIATAAYGSPLHSYVKILRNFRDTYLMPRKLGRSLVDLYYKYSPLVADLIAKHKALKLAARISLIPLVAFSYSMLHFGLVFTTFMFLFIFLLPIPPILFCLRRMRRVEAKSPKALASRTLKKDAE